MRVLLVAPSGNLPLANEEVQDITRSGLAVSLLIGNVNKIELLRDIRGGSYDILWFAAHGNSEGVQLSDGILTTGELIPLIRERFRLVVLNSCSSLLVAQQIQEEANVGVIATLTDVPDQHAYQFGSLLASNLAAGKTFSEAYKLSKRGGNRIYLYLPALDVSQDSIDTLLNEMTRLSKKISDMEIAMQNERHWWRLLAVIAVGFYPAAWIIMWSIISRF